MPELLTVGMGLVVPLVTQWLREAKWFSFVGENDKGKIKALAAVLSAVAAGLTAQQAGTFDEAQVKDVLDTSVMFAQTLGVSSLIHHWFLKKT